MIHLTTRVKVFNGFVISNLATGCTGDNAANAIFETSHEPIGSGHCAEGSEDTAGHVVNQGEVGFFWELRDGGEVIASASSEGP
jgi:hypothetical protein